MKLYSKHVNGNAMDNFSFAIKSVSVFFILMVLYFMLGSLNTTTIALLVFITAVIIFSAAFISAKIKDRVQRRNASRQTVFES